MSPIVWFFVAMAAGILAFGGYRYLRRQAFSRALAAPFPEQWTAYLQRVPVYDRLSAPLQRELQTKIKSFLYTKRFVGCEGLSISDEMRVVIAAEACLLLLNRPSTEYQALKWIYVFPSTFVHRQPQIDADGIVSTPTGALLGVSWANGRVVLSWDEVKRGVADFEDGQNVVLHEFAHQLDQENRSTSGMPLLYNKASYRVWSEVFSEEFAQLQHKVATGSEALIDSYGATNAAEFFAVVTELFYERPHALRDNHPQLFEALANYFKVDPRDWHEPKESVTLLPL